MKSSAKKVELAPYDDLFSTEESRQDAKLEKIQEIPLSELHPFKGHPFKVKDDEAMMETADSVRQYGVLVPAIARPDPEGGYELVAGHRRHRASELAEKETMPVIVRDLDDDAATKSIENRESESARAYGRYQNVFLTDEELADLQASFPAVWEQYIEKLSEYMASTGKRYQSHAATIRRWAGEDAKKAAPPTRNRDYSVKEDETV